MTKWQTFKYYLKPHNMWEAVLNGMFRVEMYFRPKKKAELDNFIKQFEYDIYRYSVLDNCTCKKTMDKNNEYILSIDKMDDECYAHGDID